MGHRALLILALVGCAHMHTFTPHDRDEVTAVLTTQAAAWNRGDIDGFMAGYERTSDLVFTSGGQIRRGFDEALAHYKQKYGGDTSTMGHLSFDILGVQPLGADGAVVLGRWKLDGPNAGGGIFSVVLERRPEGWRIVHDHTSSDP